MALAGHIPWKVASDKTDSGILNSFDFKDRKGVLYSLFAVDAAGSDAANQNDFTSEQQKNSPMHKRTRTNFDELLGNAAKKSKAEKGKRTRLLSLDGGGIKGLVRAWTAILLEGAQSPINRPIWSHCV